MRVKLAGLMLGRYLTVLDTQPQRVCKATLYTQTATERVYTATLHTDNVAAQSTIKVNTAAHRWGSRRSTGLLPLETRLICRSTWAEAGKQRKSSAHGQGPPQCADFATGSLIRNWNCRYSYYSWDQTTESLPEGEIKALQGVSLNSHRFFTFQVLIYGSFN